MKIKIVMLLLCTAAMIGCRGYKGDRLVTTIDGFTQGTYYHIVYMSEDTLNLQPSIDSLLVAVDNSMSIFNENSLLSRLNRNETDTLDRYITYCINTAREVSDMTDGMYDITITPLVEAWGFASKEQEAQPNLDSLVRLVGYKRIYINEGLLIKSDPNMRINLNSIAKGYTSDLVAQLIEGYGVEDYLVEIGGEIVAKGRNPKGMAWVVSVDKPIEGNYVPGAETQVIFSITDKALATSGNYRNFHYDDSGRKVVHTINPKTGESIAGNLLSATIVTNTCARADALGTAMMTVGLERAIELIENDPTIWAYLVYSDDKGEFHSYVSPELKKRIVNN